MQSVHYLAIVLLICLIISLANTKLSCKNEKNLNVDWFVNYKLPKNSRIRTNSLLKEGRAYSYFASDSLFTDWKLSQTDIASNSSMFGKTLQVLYSKKKGLTYLLYNDESPNEEDGSSVGHTKGIVVFDSNSGFWIIHSIPGFPPEDSYIYPSSGFENGQSILCISFYSESLNEIGKQLIYNGANVYASNLNDDVANLLDNDVKSLFTDKPIHIRRAPFTRITTVKSQNEIEFTIFAKDNQCNCDLYSQVIAPELDSSMFVETWRRGSGTPSDPVCQRTHRILDVSSISMNVISNRNPTTINFKSMQDHSKWAITQTTNRNAKQWVCVSDINRMESQKRRGGGAACFHSPTVWRIYNSSISSSDHCDS